MLCVLQAWEIKIQEPNEYWGTVPPKVQPRLHFYNIPVSVAPKDPANPLSTLKEIHRPGDYTVSHTAPALAPLPTTSQHHDACLAYGGLRFVALFAAWP